MKSLAIIPLVLAIMLAAVPAARAGDTSCTGQLFGTINGNVVVPQGATCELTTATVTGNVLVEKGAESTCGTPRISDDFRQCSGHSVRVSYN